MTHRGMNFEEIQSGSLTDKIVPGRKPIVSMELLNFINANMEENDELTSVGKNFQNEIAQFKFDIVDILKIVKFQLKHFEQKFNFRSPESALQ